MYNWEKGRYSTLEEEIGYLPQELEEYYTRTQLDRIIIDGNEIQGYFDYTYLDEKKYNKEPQRSFGGVINLNNYTTFLVSHLIVKFKYFHINEYRKFMKLINSKNEFSVTCYDIVNDCRITRNMYLAPTKMPIIHQMNLMVQGIKDFEMELIGTNTGLTEHEVVYDYNFPVGYKLIDGQAHAEQTFTQNMSGIIGENATYKEYESKGVVKISNINLAKQDGGNLINLSTGTIKNEMVGDINIADFSSGNIIVGANNQNKIDYRFVQEYTIDPNSTNGMSIDSGIGYGLGIVLNVVPNTEYTLSYSVPTEQNMDMNVGVSINFYNSKNEFVENMPSSNNHTFTTLNDVQYAILIIGSKSPIYIKNLSSLICTDSKGIRYSFNSWTDNLVTTKENNDSVDYIDGNAYFVHNDMTLHAKWEAEKK